MINYRFFPKRRLKALIKKIRFFSWLILGYLKKYSRIIFLCFILGIFFFFLYRLLSPLIKILNPPPTQTIGLVGTYTPTTIPLKIQNLISLGLTAISENGEATPAAAFSWEEKEGGKIYTFFLKKDLFWHDGTKFKAADINYNLEDVEINVLDDFTLQFKLKEPFSPFPTAVTQPLFKKGLIGLGKYKVKSVIRVGEYIQSLILSPLSNNSPLLQYKFYPSEGAALLGFKLGEVQSLEEMGDVSSVSSWPKISLISQTSFHQVVVIFYNTDYSLLSQKTVRQALTFALPEFSEFATSSSSLNPLSWAFNKKVKRYNYDLEEAKKLLSKSKEATAGGELKITLSTLNIYQDLAQKIGKSWEKLGIKTEIKTESFPGEEFQAFLTTLEIPPDPDQYLLWHSTQKATNLSRYSNPKIDKLLEDGRKLINKEERLIKYLDFQKYLVDDAPAAFLYHPRLYTLSRK